MAWGEPTEVVDRHDEGPTGRWVSAYRGMRPSADAPTRASHPQSSQRLGGHRMRSKLAGWKHLLFTAAALATLALAAGARFKSH